ncbi:Uncharacterized protein FWK35_00034980, partial [Aphis craccivora]
EGFATCIGVNVSFNSLDKYKLVTLEGKPIVLTMTNKLKMLQNWEVKKLKGGTTLSTTYINQYLHTDNRIPDIVFWNGTTDKEILQKLVLNRKMLNITSYKWDIWDIYMGFC